jgi:hypothetical protein
VKDSFNDFLFLSYTMQGIYPVTEYDLKLSLYEYEIGNIKCAEYNVLASEYIKKGLN